MEPFALLLVSATIILQSNFCVFANLDFGLQGNNDSSLSRSKRQCLTPFECETSTKIPWIPARTNCVLPEHPDGGKWTIFDGPRKHPGEIVPAKTILRFKCDRGYKLLPEVEFSICFSIWSVIPVCLKTCPSLRSTQAMHLSCEMNDVENSCIEPYEGSVARITCVLSKTNRYIKCVNGLWDTICTPVLESAADSGSECKFQFPNINDEAVVPADLGQYPFMVAISYQRQSGPPIFFCSGALIGKSYVLTSARCAKVKGKLGVRLGSLRPNTSEPGAQDLKVRDVIIHPDYKAPSTYNNIALLRLEKPVTVNANVQPISIAESAIYGRGFAIGWVWHGYDDGIAKGTLKRTTMAVTDCKEDEEHKRVLGKGLDGRTQFCRRWTTKRSSDVRSSPTGFFIAEHKGVPCKYNLVSISSYRAYMEHSSTEVDQKVYPYLEWIHSIMKPCEC